MATHNTRGGTPRRLSTLVDAEKWLTPVHGGHPVCYWSVGPGSWVIQSRDSAVSAYLRGLKTVRKVGDAVMGSQLTLWRFDGTKRKLRMIVQRLDHELSTRFASVANQAQAPRVVLLP